jgi:hypothetical protein
MAERKPFGDRLIEAMGEMANPTKSNTATVPTRNGGQYRYNYESLDQVLAAVRQPLIAHGIGLTQHVAWNEITNTYVLRTIVFDSTERQVLDERPMYMSADAQACGSFETYMRRYALRSAFGLCGEDDDGQVATNMARSKAARATAPGQQKAPATAPHSGPDRQKMLVKCAKLGAEFIELGGTVGSTEKYMAASFGTEDMQDLTDEQIIQLGQHLNETVGQLKEQKGNQQ